MNQESREAQLNSKAQSILENLAQIPIDPNGITTDVEGISDGIEALFSEMGTEDIGELVAGAVDSGLITQEQGGEILGIATWSGRTNGAALQPTIERWLLEGKDPVRVGLALKQHTFPFSDGAQMSQVLSRIASLYPQYAEISRQLIARRRDQGV